MLLHAQCIWFLFREHWKNTNNSTGSDFIHLFAWKEPSVGDWYLTQLPLSIMLPLVVDIKYMGKPCLLTDANLALCVI